MTMGLVNKIQRRLLLDYDGVILRSKRMTAFQFTQSVLFMKKNLPKVSPSECAYVNKSNYKKYGHTVLLMNNLYQCDVTLEDYNNYVFDSLAMKNLKIAIEQDAVHHMRKFDYIVKECLANDVAVEIFTNAPETWVRHTACHNFLSDIPVIHPEGDIARLKPAIEAYVDIEKDYPESTFLFVDDSETNLNPVKHMEKWNTLLLTDSVSSFHKLNHAVGELCHDSSKKLTVPL